MTSDLTGVTAWPSQAGQRVAASKILIGFDCFNFWYVKHRGRFWSSGYRVCKKGERKHLGFLPVRFLRNTFLPAGGGNHFFLFPVLSPHTVTAKILWCIPHCHLASIKSWKCCFLGFMGIDISTFTDQSFINTKVTSSSVLPWQLCFSLFFFFFHLLF